MIVHHHPFVKAVEQSLRNDCGLRGGERLLAAVSGGADSLALLRVLYALADRPQWQLQVHVGHVQHHLREEAEDDARFVADLAEQLGLAFTRRDVEPGTMPGNLEANARRLRYALLGEMAGAIDADALVTAHHADDQLETLLMRLVRGTALKGLGGIAPVRHLHGLRVLRPMLDVTRQEAIDFLQAIGQDWREDATNADTTRWRAKLRHDVLPVLRQLRGDAAGKANQSATLARRAVDFMERRVHAFERQHVHIEPDQPRWMSRRIARRTPPALLGEVIRHQAVALGIPADRMPMRVVDSVVEAARDGSGATRRFELTEPVVITVDAERVIWSGG